jgi:DEAD/DEAH box helicase domain-containing protein
VSLNAVLTDVESGFGAPEAPAPDRVAALAARLKRKYRGCITAEAVTPAQLGCYSPLPDSIDPRLRQALQTRGVRELYSHQAEAWRLLEAGGHCVVATPTASGKTLCFNGPVLNAALQHEAKALYLFPTKALAQDQVAELMELNRAGELGVRAYTFDGDTPSDARQAVRTKGDVVVTNPDMLHQAILPHHTKWAQFFQSLRFIVIDEVHSYRGVFGAHVANVLRRLQRICAFYGVRPQYICCSATIGNPREHAQALTGMAMQAVTDSGAPRGASHLLFWNPPPINPDLGIRASARSQVSKLARMSLKAGLKAILFAQSRLMVEVLTKYLKDVFDHDPRKPARVRAYRGGYLPEERRLTERLMRAGSIDAIVSTSALELGVDIGALDVALLCGYPGSIAATRQRLGRAGRRQQSALGVLVASSEALDQFVVRNPAYFLEQSPEHARIDPDQLLILLDHIRCAAFELPFADHDRYGERDIREFLEYLTEEGVLHRDGARWHWIDDSYPAGAVNLRSVADGNFVVVDRTAGKQNIIAEVDFSSAALTLYEGAIYMVQSVPWQVEKLDWVGRKAYVTRTHVDYYTDAIDYTRLKPLAEFGQADSGEGAAQHGEVHVVRRVTGYKKIRYYSHENIGYGPVNLPDQELQTTSVWWRLSPEAIDRAFKTRFEALDGFLGAAYALHTVATLLSMCEPRDLGKAVGSGDNDWSAQVSSKGRGELRGPGGEALDVETLAIFAPAVYLYDNYPGGIGLSRPLFERREELVSSAIGLISGCRCGPGCPACVGPILSADEQRSPKGSALRVLALLKHKSSVPALNLDEAMPATESRH